MIIFRYANNGTYVIGLKITLFRGKDPIKFIQKKNENKDNQKNK